MSKTQIKPLTYCAGLAVVLLLPVLLAVAVKGSIYLLVQPEDVVAVKLTDVLTTMVYTVSAATGVGYWFSDASLREGICLSISSLWKQ